MIQKVDLGDNRNLFVVSVILIAGVGGMKLKFGAVTITEVACALIIGILTNLLVNIPRRKKAEDKPVLDAEQVADGAQAEEVVAKEEAAADIIESLADNSQDNKEEN